MKPKQPKKDNKKPQAKSGEVNIEHPCKYPFWAENNLYDRYHQIYFGGYNCNHNIIIKD